MPSVLSIQVVQFLREKVKTKATTSIGEFHWQRKEQVLDEQKQIIHTQKKLVIQLTAGDLFEPIHIFAR